MVWEDGVLLCLLDDERERESESEGRGRRMVRVVTINYGVTKKKT